MPGNPESRSRGPDSRRGGNHRQTQQRQEQQAITSSEENESRTLSGHSVLRNGLEPQEGRGHHTSWLIDPLSRGRVATPTHLPSSATHDTRPGDGHGGRSSASPSSVTVTDFPGRCSRTGDTHEETPHRHHPLDSTAHGG